MLEVGRGKVGHRRNRTQFTLKRDRPASRGADVSAKSGSKDQAVILSALQRQRQNEDGKRIVIQKLEEDNGHSFLGLTFGKNLKLQSQVQSQRNPNVQTLNQKSELFQIREVNDLLASHEFLESSNRVQDLKKTKKPVLCFDDKENIDNYIADKPTTKKHQKIRRPSSTVNSQKPVIKKPVLTMQRQGRLDVLDKKMEQVFEFARNLERRNVFLEDHLSKLESEQTQLFRHILETRYKVSQIEAVLRRNKEKMQFLGSSSVEVSQFESVKSKPKDKLRVVDPGLFTQQIFKKKAKNQEEHTIRKLK